jgi:hypothetical protein
LAIKNTDPNYKGFRGPDQESSSAADAPMQAIDCTVCGRKRNVTAEVAAEQADNYVCLSCLEASEQETQPLGAEGEA